MKLSKLFRVSSLAILLVSTSILTVSLKKASAGGGFTRSCNYVRFYDANDPLLYAHCFRSDGTVNFQSRIDLNGYIANLDGRLAWQQGGGFNNSCEKKHIVDGHILEAVCFRYGNRDPQPAGLDLNTHIVNDNGELRYGG